MFAETYPMKQKDPTKFSWPGLFIVTSFCFFAFSGLTKLLDGSAEDSSLFFKIGVASFVFFAIAYAISNAKPEPKKKRRHANAYNKRLNY